MPHVGPPRRKEVIVKMQRRKDADRTRWESRNLKSMKLELSEVDNAILVNDSPSVRDFGPVSMYTLLRCQMVPYK